MIALDADEALRLLCVVDRDPCLPVSERRRDLHARMLTARPDALSALRQLL
jgi:hypothetical protein